MVRAGAAAPLPGDRQTGARRTPPDRAGTSARNTRDKQSHGARGGLCPAGGVKPRLETAGRLCGGSGRPETSPGTDAAAEPQETPSSDRAEPPTELCALLLANIQRTSPPPHRSKRHVRADATVQ